jgi:hypothetical protein
MSCTLPQIWGVLGIAVRNRSHDLLIISDITIPFSYVGGIKGYDYVLFVTSRPISTDLTLAFARSCQSERYVRLIVVYIFSRLGNLEGRPIVGIININPTPLDTSEASYRVCLRNTCE